MPTYTLRQADLIFVRGKGLSDRVIENITHSPYSHVAGIVKDNELVESQFPGGVRYQALDAYDGYADIYTCDALSDEQRQGIVAYVLSKLGARYSLEEIGWELVHFALHFDLPSPDDGTCEDCSQLWSDAYLSVGVDLCPGGPAIRAPGDLAKSPLLRMVASI